jgi:hypothetical protein
MKAVMMATSIQAGDAEIVAVMENMSWFHIILSKKPNLDQLPW